MKAYGKQIGKEWTLSTAEPSVNDLNPVAPEGQEIEPVAVIDTTGSMTWPNADNDPAERRAILGEAMGGIVTALAAKDSQAAAEEAAGEDKGGLLTFTFADGQAVELGDLAPDNWQDKWNAIRWGGGTVIMPGYNAALEAYMEEFGSRSPMDRPQLAMVIFTDGEANDTDEFASALEQVKGKGYVILAILGHGAEHDRALEVYNNVATSNDHVRVVTFGSLTDPTVISDGILSLLGEK